MPQQYTLSVNKSGSGAITSSPSGINCGSDCSQTYNNGTSVTLYANPSSGYQFAGWSGACSGTGPCTVSMNSNKSVTANFAASYSCEGSPSSPISYPSPSGVRNYSAQVCGKDYSYYKVTSIFYNITFELINLVNDADLYIYSDSSWNNLIDSSLNYGTTPEYISYSCIYCTVYIKVYGYDSDGTSFTLRVNE
ncbi:MAG: hypothetical protein OQK82_02025 [Candidatus Pacearchaeota archaeon]|nr:hypothetical protein [Candidatus Pacearchaeota archaeon]